MEENWSIKHSEYIIDRWVSDNKEVIDNFYKDVGNPEGTFIVWNKSFECSRNNETSIMYPEYKEFFEKVNSQTFDLMDIFKNQHYFHPDFKWSASIKKVLPVLTDISYDDLEVCNWWAATELLQKIVLWTIDENIYNETVTNLLTYCKQDTWAMVEIYRKILEKINDNS